MGIFCLGQPAPGVRCNDSSKISGCCQAMTTKVWQMIGPYSVHLGEEGYDRRRSVVCCQTDGSEQGREASMIPGRGREQVNRLVVTGLPRDCAVLTRVQNLA